MGDVTIVPVNTLDVYRELLSAPTVEVPFNADTFFSVIKNATSIYFAPTVEVPHRKESINKMKKKSQVSIVATIPTRENAMSMPQFTDSSINLTVLWGIDFLKVINKYIVCDKVGQAGAVQLGTDIDDVCCNIVSNGMTYNVTE